MSELHSPPTEGDSLELTDKIIVVTGAASGIGRAMAIRLKAECAAHIVAVDINIECAQATAEIIYVIAMSADFSKEDAIQRVIEDTENNVGPIDLFCSNAGVGMGESINSPNKEWQMSWDINVMSHIYAARHLLPLMVARGGGYFLNTSSAAGLLNQIGGAAYGVTKHAAVGFGEWLAIHHKHEGIKVSMLCPQAVRTAMTDNDNDATAAAASNGMIEPEELCETVVEGLRAESFMILPHPVVLEYMRNKTSNYDRWIGGMNKLMRKIVGLN